MGLWASAFSSIFASSSAAISIRAPTLPSAAEQCLENPTHLGLGFLHPRLQRRKIRRVASPRQHAQEIFPGGFRGELVTDAEPQNLCEVVIETGCRTQDFRGGLGRERGPGGVVRRKRGGV